MLVIITLHDRVALDIRESKMFDIIGKIISAITIVVLIWLELWQVRKREMMQVYGR